MANWGAQLLNHVATQKAANPVDAYFKQRELANQDADQELRARADQRAAEAARLKNEQDNYDFAQKRQSDALTQALAAQQSGVADWGERLRTGNYEGLSAQQLGNARSITDTDMQAKVQKYRHDMQAQEQEMTARYARAIMKAPNPTLAYRQAKEGMTRQGYDVSDWPDEYTPQVRGALAMQAQTGIDTKTQYTQDWEQEKFAQQEARQWTDLANTERYRDRQLANQIEVAKMNNAIKAASGANLSPYERAMQTERGKADAKLAANKAIMEESGKKNVEIIKRMEGLLKSNPDAFGWSAGGRAMTNSDYFMPASDRSAREEFDAYAGALKQQIMADIKKQTNIAPNTTTEMNTLLGKIGSDTTPAGLEGSIKAIKLRLNAEGLGNLIPAVEDMGKDSGKRVNEEKGTTEPPKGGLDF
ncbi:hypothetical protein FACS1894186_4930 [Alphaproteobacteria bacterium]|nr:hypothetical protein FACS1894186_4930 [Alphaproteobacteria bacterium]